MGWAMVIFLCLNATPRERCNEETAVSVIRPVERYPDMTGCAVAAMLILPTVAADDTRPVIRCVRQ